MKPDLSAMRQEYSQRGFLEADLAPTWLAQLERWLADARAAGLPEPNAMVLATADERGRPSARTVLLKGLDERGLVFFTNLGSRKAGEIAANPYASVVFPWHAMGRQVLVGGGVCEVDRAETEAYFATRPRDSRLGAWASPQSRVVPDRADLDRRLAEATQRFQGEEIPAPPHWGGLRIEPETVEFWQGGVGRLHDRLRYRRAGGTTSAGSASVAGGTTSAGSASVAGGGWLTERLGP